MPYKNDFSVDTIYDFVLESEKKWSI